MSDIQRARNEQVIQAAIDEPAAAVEPHGIGGWLLVVAFSQVVAVLQLSVLLGRHYLDTESLEAFEQFPVATYGELAMNVGLLLLVATTAALLFRKSRYFPRFFISQLLAVIALAILSTVWVALALSIQLGAPFSELLVIERQDVVQFCVAVASALIWIPYILKSRRVKNTFVDAATRAELAARTADRMPSPGIPLLRAVVYAVFAMGLVAILVGLGHAIGRGVFSGQLIGGAVQMALAIWLFRGSDAARVILAVLFAFGLVGFIAIAFLVPGQEPIAIAVMLALATVSAGGLWILIFSKRFRAELAINAAKYRRPEAEEA